MNETSAISEHQFLLAHCRAELIRAWTDAQRAGQRIGYRQWKARCRTLRAIEGACNDR